ncbi:MAG: glycosyltransferase family 2 protein [Planctomycetota bacterium]
MLNIVVPMAGRGSRFRQAGFMLPKPLIPVGGRPMIEVVIENIRPRTPHRFIFITLRELAESHQVDRRLRQWAHGAEVHFVDGVTEGAACTVLTVKSLIDNRQPLMIANCDQFVDIDIQDYLDQLDRDHSDGLIMTMWADHPKWSYVRSDSHGRVCEVVEKQVVSNDATVGIYNYRHGCDFVAAAESMIRKNLRVNGEFYVAPAYNEMLAQGARLSLYNIGREYAGMHGLGIPEDLEIFERMLADRQLKRFARAA